MTNMGFKSKSKRVAKASYKGDDVAPQSYLNGIHEHSYLTREQERKLLQDVQSPNQMVALSARDRLVYSHMRLALKWANMYSKTLNNGVISRDDLIQEANMGLCKAAEKFDMEQTVRFATYAVFWIKAELQDFLHHNSTHVKFGASADARKVVVNYRRLRNTLREQQPYLSEKEINASIARTLCVTPGLAADMGKVVLMSAFELDKPYAATGDQDPVSNYLIDPAPLPDALVASTIDTERQWSKVEKALKKLKPREQAIIKARYLLDDAVKLDTLGERFKVSKERIRQIEVAALSKLRLALKGHERTSVIEG